jgi:S-adenosylmethionine:tRNA ribosyltransferase-isomerase
MTERLLKIEPATMSWSIGNFETIVDNFREKDLLVVNDAATFPASLNGFTSAGEQIELRLNRCLSDSGPVYWEAVLFGRGDWRQRTEDRAVPPKVYKGDWLRLGVLSAKVEKVSDISPRLLTLKFPLELALFWESLYRSGKPVQYSYLEKELDLWSVQTPYASYPAAAEMPSAGRSISIEMISRIRDRGAAIATLTHSTGLSSTGDVSIDRILPFAETSDIPESTVEAIEQSHRVYAVGTSVARALEGRFLSQGKLVAGRGATDLVLTAKHTPKVLDGILTGVHEVSESHFKLLEAFAPKTLLSRAIDDALKRGLQLHEFGDFCFISS